MSSLRSVSIIVVCGAGPDKKLQESCEHFSALNPRAEDAARYEEETLFCKFLGHRGECFFRKHEETNDWVDTRNVPQRVCPPRPAGDWRPIATAPKNNTLIVVYGEHPEYGHHTDLGHYTPEGKWMSLVGHHIVELTHWMPLLPLPGK
ncbi:MAG: hypothetical protein FWG17_04680 [Desulfovibrionaceae bacterium]|nr:hypothetical protein [Desulfovibrionaceae bacterium]